MTKEFNPSEYKSFEDLPEDQRGNFEAIEGGEGFVLKSVEKNPEIANRLAIAEDRVINRLRQEIENQGLSISDLLAKYSESAITYDYKTRDEFAELLKQIADYSILQNNTENPQIEEEFKKRYQQLTYSKLTQVTLLESIEFTDLEVIAKLLADNKFSLKEDLLKKVDTDEVLMDLFNLSRNNLSVVVLLIARIKNSVLKIEILKSVQKSKSETDGGAQTDRSIKSDIAIKSIEGYVVNALLDDENYDEALRLIDCGDIWIHNFKSNIHKIKSDTFLFELAKRNQGLDILYVLKFITDSKIFDEIISNEAREFSHLPEPEKQKIIDWAQKLRNSLVNEPEVYQAGNLGETNKFIIGVPADGERLFISWSNTDNHHYHKDIFNSLSRKTGKTFGESFRSGGYITLGKNGENTVVIFDNSSGDFGNYSFRVLEKFRDQIILALQEKLGTKNITLIIDVSS